MSRPPNQRAIIASAAIVIVSLTILMGSSTGRTGATRLNGSGCTCHGTISTPGVLVALSGPDTLAPGAASTYTLTVTGGPLAAAGTDIAASAGSLNVIDGSGLKKSGTELTHSSPRTPSASAVSWSFSYTAPASPGTATIFANGNSVDLSGDNSGDSWNFAADKVITIASQTSVSDPAAPLTYSLGQNYPNPFNPSTTVRYSLPERSIVTLTVYDVSGTAVGTLMSGVQEAGSHSVVWTSGLASGVYFYRLEALSTAENGRRFSETRKMVLLK